MAAMVVVAAVPLHVGLLFLLFCGHSGLGVPICPGALLLSLRYLEAVVCCGDFDLLLVKRCRTRLNEIVSQIYNKLVSHKLVPRINQANGNMTLSTVGLILIGTGMKYGSPH